MHRAIRLLDFDRLEWPTTGGLIAITIDWILHVARRRELAHSTVTTRAGMAIMRVAVQPEWPGGGPRVAVPREVQRQQGGG